MMLGFWRRYGRVKMGWTGAGDAMQDFLESVFQDCAQGVLG